MISFVEGNSQTQLKSRKFENSGNNNNTTIVMNNSTLYNLKYTDVSNNNHNFDLVNDSSSSADSILSSGLSKSGIPSTLTTNSEYHNSNDTENCNVNDKNQNKQNKYDIITFQIHENEIKKEARKQTLTNKEYQLIIENYNKAINLNVESIFAKNYPNVIEYRNMTYNDAKKKKITVESNNLQRLQYIAKVVEHTYYNIEPPDEYTKKSDRKHFKEVAVNAVTFCKKKNKIPSIELIVSCWLHDIERFIPHIKCEYLPEHIDEYRKEIIHPMTSAQVALALLNGAPLTVKEKDNIFALISQHDKPIDFRIVVNNVLLSDIIDEELKETLETLMDADSFAFFQAMTSFILFKCKTNTKEWIWKRIVNNLKRLRGHLREDAVKLILNLPNHVMEHIAFDIKQLNVGNNNNDNNNSDFNTTNNNEMFDKYIRVAANNVSITF